MNSRDAICEADLYDLDEEDTDDPTEHCPECGAHVSEQHALDCGYDDEEDDDDNDSDR